jgi:hypothetical protein
MLFFPDNFIAEQFESLKNSPLGSIDGEFRLEA